MSGVGPMPDQTGSEASLGPVLDFMRLLWAIDHALQRASKRMALALGATGPQRLVIRIVGRFPGISPGRLAGIMHAHPSTLTGILRRLVDAGLLRRSSDPGDRRRALLRLTCRGRELSAQSWGTVEGALRSALRDVSKDDLRRAQSVLDGLARELTRRWPQAGASLVGKARNPNRGLGRVLGISSGAARK